MAIPNYVNGNNLLPIEQYGFRKGILRLANLLIARETLVASGGKNGSADVSKAFDKVSHFGLELRLDRFKTHYKNYKLDK